MVRIDELGELAEKLLSGHLRNESLRKEAEARDLLASRQADTALVLLERAFALQAEVNESFPQSAAVDRKRIFILEREIREQQAEPLYQESVNQEKAGEEALSSGLTKEAQAYFHQGRYQLYFDHRAASKNFLKEYIDLFGISD